MSGREIYSIHQLNDAAGLNFDLNELRGQVSKGIAQLSRQKSVGWCDLPADMRSALSNVAEHISRPDEAENVRIVSALSTSAFNSLNLFLRCLPNIHLIEGLRLFTDLNNRPEFGFSSDIPTLIRKSKFPNADDCVGELLGKTLRALSGMLVQQGGTLVVSEVRQFEKSEDLNWLNSKSTLVNICSEYFTQISHLLVISDPYRAYDEAVSLGAISPSQSSLVAYLAVIKETLQQVDHHHVVRVETLIESKSHLMQAFCEVLAIHVSEALKSSVLVDEVFERARSNYWKVMPCDSDGLKWSHDLQSEESNALRSLIGYSDALS